MKPTVTNLKKLEDLFKELAYTVRYEKGNFQSGYCIVEHRNVVVVNKFFDTEGRINTLIDILLNLEVDPLSLADKSREFLQSVIRKAAVVTEET
ncbi:MAG: hypothetical protein IPJ06_07130 [Saprospiraceae bacterium]|nr:hypothetical protein [Saprospiraceae bacterium]